MKILITTDLFTMGKPGEINANGVITSVKNLYTELTKIGHEVKILTLSRDRKTYKEGDVYYMGSLPFPVYPHVRASYISHKKRKYINEILEWKPDVIYLLRVQNERMDTPYFPSADYHQAFGVTEERLKRIESLDLSIMHPGPVNRGVELCDSAMEYRNSLICNQVENGVAARMSILSYLTPRTQNHD